MLPDDGLQSRNKNQNSIFSFDLTQNAQIESSLRPKLTWEIARFKSSLPRNINFIDFLCCGRIGRGVAGRGGVPGDLKTQS
jgi:hypothetical protein